ncbi:WxL protein peptidoglycan domain-containing protein [Streptomyces sp. NPDC090106]|uniref:COG1470 family protein n=1 Tax=Streptomyces sp. NPDC090106 TaxID=3365946 RepID=UPI0038214485
MHAAPSPLPRNRVARALVLALLTALALTLAGPTASAHAAEGEVTWTVRTAANDYGDARSSFTYGVNPGGEVQDAMVVANHGKTALRLAVYASDGFTTDKGQLDLLTRDRKSVGIGAWVHADKASVSIAPGRSAEIPFTVSVPENATPGDYVGGLLTSLRQADDAEGINVDRRLGIRVKLRVSGALNPALAVENPHVGYDGTADPFGRGDATVTYTLHNTGNVVLSGNQEVTVEGPFGMFTADAGTVAAPPELLPGESWKMTVPVRDVAPSGRLTATVTVVPLVTDASGTTTARKAVQATAHGWAVPWTLLLLLLVLLAAATAWFLLARRARSRRKGREEARVKRAVDEALREKADSAA